MLFVVTGISTDSPNACYLLNIKIKIVKLIKFYVTSGVVTKLKAILILQFLFYFWKEANVASDRVLKAFQALLCSKDCNTLL
jgi:hypothetical protein